MKHVEHFHGSDLEKIEQIYHIKKEKKYYKLLRKCKSTGDFF